MERMKSSEAAKIPQDTVQLTVQRVADHEVRVLRRMRSCWWFHVQSDTSVSTKFQGIRRSSFGRIIHVFRASHWTTWCLFDC